MISLIRYLSQHPEGYRDGQVLSSPLFPDNSGLCADEMASTEQNTASVR